MTAARVSLGQKIQLPQVRLLAELFCGIGRVAADAVPARFEFKDYGWFGNDRWERDEHILIGPYLGFSLRIGGETRRGSCYVTPTEAAADVVRKTMIAAGVNDRIAFEVIDHGEELLVVARNNVIIGSRWLALIPAERNRAVLEEFL